MFGEKKLSPGVESKPEFVSSILPLDFTLKNGDLARLSHAQQEHIDPLRLILNSCILDGISCPYWSEMERQEFDSHFNRGAGCEGFVVTIVSSEQFEASEVIGGFYIKPNYTGRSSHICNGGFIVKIGARGLGVSRAMATAYLKLAKELEYVGSMFNLVYSNNPASFSLWKSLNFVQIGVVPLAGKCRNEDGSLYYVDALQFYYDLRDVVI